MLEITSHGKSWNLKMEMETRAAEFAKSKAFVNFIVCSGLLTSAYEAEIPKLSGSWLSIAIFP